MSVPTLRAAVPGEFIAAVPAMLGFYPVDSVVVALLERRGPDNELCIKVVVRHDLRVSDARLTDAATRLAELAANENTAAVLVLVVDSTAQPAHAPHSELTHAVGILDRALTARGVVLGAAWATRVIEAGARWWSVHDATKSGVVPDPDASPIAATYVLDGRPIRRSRQELTTLVAPTRRWPARSADCSPRQPAPTTAPPSPPFSRRPMRWPQGRS